LSESQAKGLLEFLRKEGFLTDREAKLLGNILSDNVLPGVLGKNINVLRAQILQSVLLTILREDI
jgi:transcriptional regulator CtsR